MARYLLGTFHAAREGRFADTDPLLGELLGRQPRTVRDLLAGR
jgi:NAD(P)H dehydrogenase (quinone)